MEPSLKNIYFDVKHPASFGSVSKLAKAGGVSRKEAQDFLMKQDAYTLHKPVRLKFPSRLTLAYFKQDLWQADLLDMKNIADHNNGVKYLLVVIDVFTRFAYVEPLKDKTAKSVFEGFKKIFTTTIPPINLQTDDGLEFFNTKVKSLLKKHKINHYSSYSEHKASVVERLNRTIKNKIYRYMTYRKNYKYIDVLQDLIKSYNDSVHSSIGIAPTNVTPTIEKTLFAKQFGYVPLVKYTFTLGDQVRISKHRKTFHRGYQENWTDEVFIVSKQYPTQPPTYVLTDLDGEPVEGKFYASGDYGITGDAGITGALNLF